MQQKVCFSKRLGYLALFGVVILVGVVALNQLTRQQTSTNSRASEIPESALVVPTQTPKCNTYGDVVVKDAFNVLWSWGSITVTAANGRLYCISELYKEIPPANKVVVEVPTDVNVKYSETFSKIGGKCFVYGVKIYIKENGNVPYLAGTYNAQVPAKLVGLASPETTCDTASPFYPKCTPYKKVIGQNCWNISFEQCKILGEKKCCSQMLPSLKDCPISS